MSLSFDSCAAMNLRRTARLIGQFFDQRLQPGGLRNTQFSLLVMLRSLAPLSITDLAEHLGMDRTTLTRNVKVLQKDGLIVERLSTDARVRLLALTEKGQATIEEHVPLWQQAQSDFLARLGEDRWTFLQAELLAINREISKA